MRGAVLLALLLAACASSSDLIESETINCAEMGNEVSVMLSGVTIEGSSSPLAAMPDAPLTIDVEVSNNTHNDIVVKRIVLVPRSEPRARFRMNNAYGQFAQTIAEGKDHVFTLRTTGRWVRNNEAMPNDPREEPSGSVEVESRVELGNGQTYRCAFSLPVH